MIPKSWDNITLSQYIQLKNIDKNDFNTLLEYQIEQICILLDIDSNDSILDNIDYTELSNLVFLNKQPNKNFKKNINNLYFKELTTLTLGEFIDLDYYFSIDYNKKLPNICSILYRQNKTNIWNHIIIEPRTYNEEERSNLFYDININDIYGIIPAYIEYKKYFIDGFENMFNQQDEELEEIPESNMTIEDILALKEEKKAKKWNWERLIYEMANGDSLKFNEVTEMSLIFVFNQLSMKKDLKL